MITIKATANFKKRTYTIRKQENGKTFAKYRTLTLSEEEFEECEMNTEGDWYCFLREDTGSYYRL